MVQADSEPRAATEKSSLQYAPVWRSVENDPPSEEGSYLVGWYVDGEFVIWTSETPLINGDWWTTLPLPPPPSNGDRSDDPKSAGDA